MEQEVSMQDGLDRRRFLVSGATIAGGMMLWLRSAGAEAANAPSAELADADLPWGPDVARNEELSAWISISPEDIVTIRVPRPEMGNGVASQVAMNVAEELACDWSKVRVEFASVHRDFVEGGTYSAGPFPFASGNSTTKELMARNLQLGASARERLKAAAAARWQVPASRIVAKESVLTDTASGRALRYGEVAAEAATIDLVQEPALKPQSQWTLIGKASPPKLHLSDVVSGKLVYGIDVKVPGMVHAALLQCPVHGGRLKYHDPAKVRSMPGVRAVVVVDPSETAGSPVPTRSTFGMATTRAQWGVAVIADHYWQAKTALDALPVEWDTGDVTQWRDDERIDAARRAMLAGSDGEVVTKTGNPGIAGTGQVVEADYATPLCEHAAIEPLNGTALVTADGAEAWVPAQDLAQAYWVAIDETGLSPEKVRIHGTYIGGGFGRRTQADDVRMVLAVAKRFPGIPVKVIWSREETFRQGRYRSPVMTGFRARLDPATGLPASFEAKSNVSRPLRPDPGEPDYVSAVRTFGLSDMPYLIEGAIPNVSVRCSELPIHIMTGPYRCPFNNAHAFMLESFIDECAIAANADRLDYRLRLLAHWDRSWSDCLRLVARKAGWGSPLRKGEGLGLAISAWPLGGQRQSATVVAIAARVCVDEKQGFVIPKIDVAIDCGRAANLDGIRAQIEGAVIFGLNAALNEEITIGDGVVTETNFDSYPILRMASAPRQIEVHFDALSGHDRYATVGEVATGPIGAAIGNAIFDATGIRLRRTPFRKDQKFGKYLLA